MKLVKKKKSVHYRGGQTHGCGSKKKRRGAGNRGGRGNAGSGKRADQKRPSYWQIPTGKHGFVHHNATVLKAINMEYLQRSIRRLVEEKKATFENGVYTINLTSLGFDKLLSKGKVNLQWEIHVEKATEQAIKKVEASGGKVILKEE